MAKKQNKDNNKGLQAVAKAEKTLRKAQAALTDATRRLAELVGAKTAAPAAPVAPAAPAPVAAPVVKAAVEAPVKATAKAPVRTTAKAPVKTAVKPAVTKPATKAPAKSGTAALGVIELREQAKAKGVAGYSRLSKAALIEALAK